MQIDAPGFPEGCVASLPSGRAPNLLLLLFVFHAGGVVSMPVNAHSASCRVLYALGVWVSHTPLCVPVRDDSVGVTTGENALEHSDGRWWA